MTDEDPNCRTAPGFASSFRFELNYTPGYKSGEYYIRVLYNGSPLDMTTRCSGTINKYFCPYKAFKKLLHRDFILDERQFSKVCRPLNSTIWRGGNSLLAIAVILLLGVVAYLYFKLRKFSNEEYIH